MKLIILCLMLTSCNTLTVMCVEQSQAQYNTAVKAYGRENVQLWRLKNARIAKTPHGTFLYHIQVKVRYDGEWYWIPNRPYTEAFDKHPQTGCKPYKRLK